jgi:glucose-6-phosphate 1-dehydrogenase
LNYTIVIFGGNGDLTYRKLLPALYNLTHDKVLNSTFAVVAVGRRAYSNQRYQEDIYEALKKYSRFKLDEDLFSKLKDNIFYKSMDFKDVNAYEDLNDYLKLIDDKFSTEGKRIYYLAVAPEYFETIVDNLHTHNMHKVNGTWSRVVIEKPFGRDLKSAQYLNQKIVSVFTEANTYRIDHYLGKEMLQNIMVIRFANTLFEPLWSNKYIEQVQISSTETLGIGSRGEYYEKSGAIRDMAQSHLLQLLCLIAMEKPNSLNPDDIKNEKVKVLQALKQYSVEKVNNYVIRGQYETYRQEPKVNQESDTETFVAFKTFVNNSRWQGVPFYIRTGKKMPIKTTEIIIQFKDTDNNLYPVATPNYLVIKIQPREGVFFQFNAKEPGTLQKIVPVQMDFCQNCQVGINSPEAYERLFFDIMRTDSTLFARWDEVEYAWKFIDSIINAWKESKPKFPNYQTGSFGPKEADELLKKDHHSWINLESDIN